MSLIENVLSRRGRAREPAIRPALVHWSQAPAVLAAAEERRKASERVAELTADLAAVEERVKTLELQAANTGIGAAELEGAENDIRISTRELRWARFAVTKAANDLTAAREAAQVDVASAGVQALGVVQQRFYAHLAAIVATNAEFAAVVEQAEGAGLNLGQLVEQNFPFVDPESLKRWKQNARWLRFAPPRVISDTPIVGEAE